MTTVSFLESGILQPQAGPQEVFASTSADIAIYGGAAFGGKTMALIMEPMRHISRRGFSATIFRRTYPEIFAPGGLWDTAEMIYPGLGGVPKYSSGEWHWPQHGTRIKFAHLQHEKDKFSWMSSQLPLIELDELTHFSEGQFWYLSSRNRLSRPMGGLRPYMRAGCNPDNNSWVAALIEWWIDQDTGFAIPERSGVVRWFVRVNGEMRWADTRKELAEYGMPKSFTFVASKIFDNKIGMATDPGYLANLQALPAYERAQLLDGNWKVARTNGVRFKRHWFKVIDAEQLPIMERIVRYWDRAATEISPTNKDPDRTAGCQWGRGVDGYYYVMDMALDTLTPGGVKRLIRETANQDRGNYPDAEVWLEEDPGQAGKAERADYADFLAEYGPRFNRPTGSKWVRSGPFSAAAESGRVRVVRAPWNKKFFDELESFSDPDDLLPGEEEGHDDQVDAGSGGFSVIAVRSDPRVRGT
jgi:predicted phage terminase large subunit-like protein